MRAAGGKAEPGLAAQGFAGQRAERLVDFGLAPHPRPRGLNEHIGPAPGIDPASLPLHTGIIALDPQRRRSLIVTHGHHRHIERGLDAFHHRNPALRGKLRNLGRLRKAKRQKCGQDQRCAANHGNPLFPFAGYQPCSLLNKKGMKGKIPFAGQEPAEYAIIAGLLPL